jgi:hypothetical protein
VLGDSLGAGIVAHLSKGEMENIEESDLEVINTGEDAYTEDDGEKK